MILPLAFGFLIGTLVLMVFFVIWRFFGPSGDDIENRLLDYEIEYELYSAAGIATLQEEKEQRALPIIKRLFVRGAFGKKLSLLLSQANWSLNPAEFVLLMIIGAMTGVVIGIIRSNFLYIAIFSPLLAFLPYFFLRRSATKRRMAIGEQTSDLLKFLTGALRAGFGLNQALESIADQLPSPMKEEIQRVIQSVRLGLSLPEALMLMAQRVESDELDMLVVAINVQYESGGNLAPTLESIGKTIQDRLRLKREIRSLTAQQRFTGYILALLPIGLAILLYFINPSYIMRLFQPGWIRLLPAAAGLMMFMGFLVIRKIVQIEV